MDEEIRIMPRHGGIGFHAAIVGIDAPALAGRIARPDEADGAAACGRGAETANDVRAHDIGLGKVGEGHAVEDCLARRQAGQ